MINRQGKIDKESFRLEGREEDVDCFEMIFGQSNLASPPKPQDKLEEC